MDSLEHCILQVYLITEGLQINVTFLLLFIIVFANAKQNNMANSLVVLLRESDFSCPGWCYDKVRCIRGCLPLILVVALRLLL